MNPLINLWTDLHLSFNTLAAALNVLAAMITPVLLLSATGTYVFSTTTRLGRVIDRMRLISDKVEALAIGDNVPLRAERIANYRAQMKRLNVRLLLLQKIVTLLYLASATFVLTSVAIGLAAVVNIHWYWIPVLLGLVGAFQLLVASVMLIAEARHAVADLQLESDFLREVAGRFADFDK